MSRGSQLAACPDERIDCRAGERYRIRRIGKPLLIVQVVEVHENLSHGYRRPKAFYVALTRNGTRRRKGRRWEPDRACAHLTWRDGAWRFPHGERIEDE